MSEEQKWHVGPDRKPHKCTASKRTCPLGTKNHYNTLEEATDAAERLNTPSSSRRLSKRDSVKPVPGDPSTGWKPAKRSLLESAGVARQDIGNMMEVAVGAKGSFVSRRDLAMAANTPEAVLAKLYEINKREVAKPEGDSNRSECILGDLAGNKRTPAWILRELSDPSQSESVVRAAASNPSTPSDTLDSIIGPNPNYIYDAGVMQAVSGNSNAPRETLRRIHKVSTDVRQRIRSRSKSGRSDGLTNEDWNAIMWTEKVGKNLALNPNTPADVAKKALSLLATSRIGQGNNSVYELDYRLIAARDPRTPAKVLANLAQTTNLASTVYASIAANPSTPADVSAAVINMNNSNVLTGRPVLGPCDTSLSIRLALASEPLRASEIDRLAGDKSSEVRVQVAYNGSTASDTLDRLADDESPRVRIAAARNTNASPNTIDRILSMPSPYAQDGYKSWKTGEFHEEAELAAASNSSTRHETLTALEAKAMTGKSSSPDSPNYQLKTMLAMNPQVSRSTLAKLTEDSVIALMSDQKHRHEAVSMLSRLAGNPSTPMDAIRLISRQKTRNDAYMRSAVERAMDRLDEHGRD